MSQIFDALQRSEAERAGNPLEAPLQANDMLRRAERQIASKWESQTILGGSESVAVEDFNPAKPEPVFDGLGSAPLGAGVANSSKHDDRLRILGQFQTLQLSLAPESRLVSLTEQDSPAAEAFRLLGVRLRDLGRTRPLKKVLITSSIPQEGKTTVAANLAFTLARSTQQKVLLLEGDVRRPALSQMFGLQGRPGICEWLRGDHKLTECVYYLEGPGVWIMPAGSSPQNPLEVLQSVKLNALMAQLADWFECIVIDSPPVLPLADTSVWMRLADGIVLVARQGTTEKKQLQRGLEAIEPQKLIGALLNCSKNQAHSHYYY
jgi:capsular exopolysaccharide synthesis family protein